MAKLIGLLALMLAGCTGMSCGGAARSQKTDDGRLRSNLVVEELAEAFGTNMLEASPSGRYVAAEYVFDPYSSIPPIIKIIERPGSKVVRHVRGQLVAGPDDSGEAFYVAVSRADWQHPTLRSTSRPDFRLSLPPPEEKPILENDVPWAKWMAYRVGQGRLVVTRAEGEHLWMGVADVSSAPKLGEMRAKSIDKNFKYPILIASSPTAGLLFVSFKVSTYVGNDGFVTALDGATLEEKWRTPWEKSQRYSFTLEPALCLTGDARSVILFSGVYFQQIDAATGRTLGVRLANVGTQKYTILRGVTGRSEVAALLLPGPRGLKEYAVVVIDVGRDNQFETLLREVPRASQPPRVFAVVPGKVLIARAGGYFRRFADRSTWEPGLERFVDEK